MQKLINYVNDIKVKVYTDEHEFVKEFFDVPEGAVLATNPESGGFACIEAKEIAIYKSDNCSFEDLLETVAHELGHLITGGFTENPPEGEEFDEQHEDKAKHYEFFVRDAYKLAKEIHLIK